MLPVTSKPATKEYCENWERIFGKKDKPEPPQERKTPRRPRKTRAIPEPE